MNIEYDQIVDAAYVEVGEPIPPEGVDDTESLDADRNVDFDAAGNIIGYEFLNVKRFGVRLDDIEDAAHREALARLFREAGFVERDWGHPIPTTAAYRRDRAAG